MQTIGDFTNMSESLALMPDEALRTFAQMHRDDPFSLALAVSESNRRKKQRVAQQGLAGMQPQPPVADQEIAQMAAPAMPENVGIGALPAPVLAGMPAGGIAGEEEVVSKAGGGLVAFADGGNVERYQTGGGIAGVPSWLQFMYSGESEVERKRRERLEAQVRAEAAARGNTPSARLQEEQARNLALAANIPTPTDPNFRRAPDPRFTGTLADSTTAPSTADATPAPAPGATPPAQTGTPPAPGATPPATGAGASPRAGGFDMTPAGLMALRKKLGEDNQLEEPKNIREAREALNTEELAARQATKAAIERDQAKFAEAFKGREERLSKREADIGKQRGENTGLAFLNAGLAIMSTPGGLATALGKGAQVGTAQYASGLEKLRSAQDKLDEARDRLDDLKLNRAEMSAKEIRDAEAGINTAKIAAKQRGVEALSNMYNISNKRADAMFNTLGEVGTTIYKEQQATARNAASVAATKDAAAATREATAAARLPVLLETTRKNIAAEATKKFPYDAAAREQYEATAFAAAVRSNPALAQYAGVAGGGGAPSKADMRFDEKTGQFVPMR